MDESNPSPSKANQLAEVIAGVPKALVPNSLKAIDRLVGAALDVPLAWLAQKKAQIDSQTEAYKSVEHAIGNAAASSAAGDKETVDNAVTVLVRQAYRKQSNREGVAKAAIEELKKINSSVDSEVFYDKPSDVLDEDWLNIFERYAEDASSERMQRLWGRVLAGEIRQPSQYSLRTLRFLSEFSQYDGEQFVDFCNSAFGDMAPKNLVLPEGKHDIRHLVGLESLGLVQGSSGIGLNYTFHFNGEGYAFIRERSTVLILQGKTGEKIVIPIVSLTPLGQELLSLIPDRDAQGSAIRVANSIRSTEIQSAFLGSMNENSSQVAFKQKIW